MALQFPELSAPTTGRAHRSAFTEGRHYRGNVVLRHMLVSRLGRVPQKPGQHFAGYHRDL
jgi:hypothetical protein